VDGRKKPARGPAADQGVRPTSVDEDFGSLAATVGDGDKEF
jgi:hypothetical protein